MRVAICSDIHGNRHGFEAVIAAAEDGGADQLWCLGDLVGYGAEPDACVELAARHCAICLAGNHDLAVVEVLSLDEFSRGAELAARWTREVIRPETREFLLSLQPQASVNGALGLFHASPRDPIWEYVLSDLAAELCLDASDFRINFIGHSHVALSFTRPEGEPAHGHHPQGRARRWSCTPASGSSIPARPGSRATATREPPGCCSTPTAAPRAGSGPSTTSQARRPRSGPPDCPIRWRNGCNTASDGPSGR